MKYITLFLTFLLLSCSTTYKNQDLEGEEIITFSGKALSDKPWIIPDDFDSESVILLIGYKQNSQFDIDRWLIGLDMKEVDTPVFEVPAIQGLIPRLIKSKIDNGMKKGIPKKLWASVITVYEDGERLQEFTGNVNPNNARVIFLKKNQIIFFEDEGFSVESLNRLIKTINK